MYTRSIHEVEVLYCIPYLVLWALISASRLAVVLPKQRLCLAEWILLLAPGQHPIVMLLWWINIRDRFIYAVQWLWPMFLVHSVWLLTGWVKTGASVTNWDYQYSLRMDRSKGSLVSNKAYVTTIDFWRKLLRVWSRVSRIIWSRRSSTPETTSLCMRWLAPNACECQCSLALNHANLKWYPSLL